jgi:hypothetical protein
MKINRTDIYSRIHKGLRKALFEFSEQAGKTNPGNGIEISELVNTGKRVIAFLELHADVEERFQLPLLKEKNPAFVVADQQDHQHLEIIIEELKSALNELPVSNNNEDGLYHFYLQLNDFIGKYLIHMHNEETITAKHFIDECNYEEISRVINAINAYTSTEQKELAMQYFMPAISLSERSDFLSELRGKNPAVYDKILVQARQFLNQHDWTELVNTLENN